MERRYRAFAVSIKGTYNWYGLERADSLCVSRSFGEPIQGTPRAKREKNEGNVTTENKKECGIITRGTRGGIFALFSLSYARLAGAKCISRKRAIALKNAF